MSCLMYGSVQPVFVTHLQLLSLYTHHDPVPGVFKVLHVSCVLELVHSLGDGRVHQVLNLGASEAGSHLGQVACVDVYCLGYLVQVQCEYVLTPVYVWQGHMYLLVKTTRPDSSRVKDVLVIGSANDQDLVVLLEAVHLRQQLVNGCAGGTVLRAETSALAEQRVYLVYEYNAGLVVFGFSEELAHTLSSYTHEHLVEVRTRAIDEAAPRLTCDGSGQQGLACAWTPV